MQGYYVKYTFMFRVIIRVPNFFVLEHELNVGSMNQLAVQIEKNLEA